MYSPRLGQGVTSFSSTPFPSPFLSSPLLCLSLASWVRIAARVSCCVVSGVHGQEGQGHGGGRADHLRSGGDRGEGPSRGVKGVLSFPFRISVMILPALDARNPALLILFSPFPLLSLHTTLSLRSLRSLPLPGGTDLRHGGARLPPGGVNLRGRRPHESAAPGESDRHRHCPLPSPSPRTTAHLSEPFVRSPYRQ